MPLILERYWNKYFGELSSPPQAKNFQDLSLTLYRKYTIHYTENTRVTVRAETAFNGTCSPETAQVSRLRRAVYGKTYSLMGMGFSPYGNAKQLKITLWETISPDHPSPIGGVLISYIAR